MYIQFAHTLYSFSDFALLLTVQTIRSGLLSS